MNLAAWLSPPAWVLLVAGGALGAAAAWQVQGWRLGGQLATQRAEHAQSLATAQSIARANEQKLNLQMEDALNAARTRETTLRRDADASRTESHKLRAELSAALERSATATEAAVREYAATASELLGECSERYSELAAKADGHASDSLMLQQAWPR